MSPFAALKKAVGDQTPKQDPADARSALAARLRDAGERFVGSVVKKLQILAGPTTTIEGKLAGFGFDKIRTLVAAHRSDSAVGLIVLDEPACSLLALLDPTLVHAMVELLCGGNGVEPPARSARETTSIDNQFAQILFAQSAATIQTEWTDFGFTGARAARVEGPLTVDTLGPKIEHVGIVNMTIGIFGLHGALRLILPPAALDRFGGGMPRASAEEERDPFWTPRLHEEVAQVPVAVGAYFDAKALPLSALTGLRVGQILQLPLDARSNASLVADGRVLFRGEIGQDEGRYSVRIADVVRDAPRSSQLAAHRFPQFERLEA